MTCNNKIIMPIIIIIIINFNYNDFETTIYFSSKV